MLFEKGLLLEGLHMFRKATSYGFTPPISAYNELLDALQRGNEMKLAWCFLGAMIQGADLDSFSWSLVAHILYKCGKFEKVVRLIDNGIYNSEIYHLLVDFYSKIGDFEAVFHRLNEMEDKKLDANFCTYNSLLDGACKYDNRDVIERIMRMMIGKQLLSRRLVSRNDSIIQKLCGLERTHAAEMMFNKACGNNIRLHDDTYGALLKAMSQVGRIDEATNMYRMMLKRGIKLKESWYGAFLNILCKEGGSDDGYGLLVNIMKQGHNPCPSQLSKYLTSLCRRNSWSKVEQLFDLMLKKGLLPDPMPCCLLMEYYCFNMEMDKVVALHDTMEKVKGSLDVTSYNMILQGLWRERKAEEAIQVFDYMIGLNSFDSESFTVMICELCRFKEFIKP
ncbi:hypothetical protein V6N13_059167 [Hibiscus sabdariffa]|uniref:Pentatricopeptide repeat-containing protein n=1 Tax=Hibiscus sabdariffa TaxID=183260 RepID=A0ABR2GE00_9ROSI